jgi:hypothetical protein
MRLKTVLLCGILVVCACVSPVRVTKPGGDNAVVVFRQGGSARVELLAVTDSSLFFLRDNAVMRTALADISRVRVAGYSVATGKYVALGAISIVNAAFCVWVMSRGIWQFVAATVPLWGLGTWWLLSDEPRVDFRSPFDTGAREQLALYCRYPQGLTDEQWQELLRFYDQDAFLSSGDMPRP